MKGLLKVSYPPFLEFCVKVIQEPALLLGPVLTILLLHPLQREGIGPAEQMTRLLIIFPKDTYLFKIISLFKLHLAL